VVQWAKPKCQVSLVDPQLEGKEEVEGAVSAGKGLFDWPLLVSDPTTTLWPILGKSFVGSRAVIYLENHSSLPDV